MNQLQIENDKLVKLTKKMFVIFVHTISQKEKFHGSFLVKTRGWGFLLVFRSKYSVTSCVEACHVLNSLILLKYRQYEKHST